MGNGDLASFGGQTQLATQGGPESGEHSGDLIGESLCRLDFRFCRVAQPLTQIEIAPQLAKGSVRDCEKAQKLPGCESPATFRNIRRD